MRGVIARTAESVFYGKLTQEQQVIARTIFLRLTELGESTQDTRRRASLQELIHLVPYGDPQQMQEVLNKLVDTRQVSVRLYNHNQRSCAAVSWFQSGG